MTQSALRHSLHWVPTLLEAPVRLIDTSLGWLYRARSRRMLASLDDRMLRDIGIDRARADGEAGKPFWRD
jgi:uncharacterized protein YjiS (DUF1127 family)